LGYASEKGHEEVVKLLLKSGANVANGMESPLVLAAARGRTTIVELLLKAAENVDYGSPLIRSALDRAAGNGHYETVKLLLDRGCDLSKPGRNDQSPLGAAAACGYLNVVRLLLDHGADGNSRNRLGDSPLISAIRGIVPIQVIRLLLNWGVDMEAKDKEYAQSALSWAVVLNGRRLKTLRLLIEAGANIETRNRDGRTPLFLTASEGDHILYAIGVLLRAGTDVGAKDNLGQCILCEPAKRGWVQVVRLLLEAGAKVEKDNSGRSPLDYAQKEGHLEVAALLAEHMGSDVL
jgi:ankyrin repeat domain-containing protein 17